ncbi:MAG: metallophosphoesterase [Spirochaetota bacterium]|nr:metallophosphoesterase [Spirochaetota bacterium]
MNNQIHPDELKNRLIEIFNRKHPPECDHFLEVVEIANSVLINEEEEIRPHDSSDLPGGMILLKHYIPTILVPDIHARMDLFLNIMLYEDSGYTNLDKMALDLLQVVCVGDGVHAERRAAKRWADAFKEFQDGYSNHKNIDEEMRESFGVMEMIMEVKSNFPANFHFLKGNHENISNEDGGGNYPFIKFSHEGPMVAYYVQKFYGDEFFENYYLFEKNLPIFAVGKNFLISHAEPRTFFNRERIIEYRNHPEVIEGLTWTDDDAAQDGSVLQMIEYYIDDMDRDDSYYFGGHRPVMNLYNSRADGRYIQIHNPNKFIIGIIKENKDIDLDEDIIEIKNNIDEIIYA